MIPLDQDQICMKTGWNSKALMKMDKLKIPLKKNDLNQSSLKAEKLQAFSKHYLFGLYFLLILLEFIVSRFHVKIKTPREVLNESFI